MAGAESTQVALAGSTPRHFPASNIFDWVTGDPFERESDYTPATHRIAPVEGSRPIFVDHKSGRQFPPLFRSP